MTRSCGGPRQALQASRSCQLQRRCERTARSLPTELNQLTALHKLDLAGNQFSSLPAEVCQLTALYSLSLSGNRLSSLPAELGQLTALQGLNAYHNQLSHLPAELGRLTALRILDLTDNRLSSLPAELGQLTALYFFALDRNPLQSPPPEIVAQGTRAILTYLRTLQQANGERFEAKVIESGEEGMEKTSVPLQPADVERFEAKVVLVGEGGMGKTSLLHALLQQPFMQGLPITHGIEVGTIRIPHPARVGQEMTLYTWDFGGQEIYQATHQFFLTQRSLYLLVWNARLGAEACRLSDWLDTIMGHAPDAKILLVATHCDLLPTPTLGINLASYQRRYSQIAGLCAISNLTGDGLEALKAQIAELAAQTPLVGQHWPRTWINAEQALLARPEHHLDVATFAAICATKRVVEETERETFGHYLHDLGKILYFHDDPVLRTLVVLKPNWISKAISRVLDDAQVQEAGGILEHRDLTRIWATDEQGHPYPHALYPIFLRMMERFALCYQLEPERPDQPIHMAFEGTIAPRKC